MKPSPESWLNPAIRVSPSAIHGRGLFAVSDIAEGGTLLVWGDGYTDAAGAREARRLGKGIMQWDEDLFSCECEANPDLYAINHSCDPSAWLADAHTVVARRAIRSGEEVTVDYGLWELDADHATAWNCHCGAASCRGKVTGRDWTRSDLQDRYRGHFSPLIEARIRRAGP